MQGRVVDEKGRRDDHEKPVQLLSKQTVIKVAAISLTYVKHHQSTRSFLKISFISVDDDFLERGFSLNFDLSSLMSFRNLSYFSYIGNVRYVEMEKCKIHFTIRLYFYL